jgi:hypothetical protein
MILKNVLPTAVGLALLFVWLMNGTVMAESRFASGFRGIAWATPKDRLPDLGLSKKSLKNIYKSGPATVLFMEGKGNLAMDMDGIPLLSIYMHFNDQLFRGVDLIFKPENRDKIYTAIAHDMGSKGNTDAQGVRWKTENLVILLTDRELMISYKGRLKYGRTWVSPTLFCRGLLMPSDHSHNQIFFVHITGREDTTDMDTC